MLSNDADTASVYRNLLRQDSRQSIAESPESISESAAHTPERAAVVPPSTYLDVQVDGRETSYFEWLGAGLYATERCTGRARGPRHALHEIHYGFSEQFLYLRVDANPEALDALPYCEFRVTVRASEELRLKVLVEEGKLAGSLLDSPDACILGEHEFLKVAFDKILEVSIGRPLVRLDGESSLAVQVELWHGELPQDSLPEESSFEVKLGPGSFAWCS